MITSPFEKGYYIITQDILLHAWVLLLFFLTAKEQILLNFPAFSGNDYMIGAPDYFW